MIPSSDRTPPPEYLAVGFETAFARLRLRIEDACAAQAPTDWPARLLAAIRAALAFAAADPAAANRLTNDTLQAGWAGDERHERLVAYLVDQLRPGRELCGLVGSLPESTERTIAARLVAFVGTCAQHGLEEELSGDRAREAIEFALTPYVGAAAAHDLACEGRSTGPTGDLHGS